MSREELEKKSYEIRKKYQPCTPEQVYLRATEEERGVLIKLDLLEASDKLSQIYTDTAQLSMHFGFLSGIILRENSNN